MTASTRAVPDSLRSVPVYDESAKRIADVYESTTFERVHAGILDLLPSPGASVLDVGSGSGRDAAALAARGYRVTAVEPSHGLREEAKRRHGDANIEWLDDALPNLHIVGKRRFAFILVSAVWMHLVSRDRLAAMRRLSHAQRRKRVRRGLVAMYRSKLLLSRLLRILVPSIHYVGHCNLQTSLDLERMMRLGAKNGSPIADPVGNALLRPAKRMLL